jgi:hypothetical protein
MRRASTNAGLKQQVRLRAGFWHCTGPERTFLHARLARQCGDTAAARKLIADCLRELPGDQDFARFAAKIGAG